MGKGCMQVGVGEVGKGWMWVGVEEIGKGCIRAEVWCMRVGLYQGRGRVMRKEREQ